MTPETEKNINEALDWVQQTGASVQDFAIEQAPLYCREVVAWEFWSGVIFGGVGVALVAIGLLAAWKFGKWVEEDEWEPTVRTVPSLVIAMFGLAVGFTAALTNTPRAIKAHIAPRMVIVEHLKGMTQ